MAKNKKVTEQSAKTSQLESQLKRALAYYDNLKRRNEEEKQTIVRFANAVLLVKFLEILDHLETAQQNLNDPGVELIIKKFKDILSAENIKEIEAESQKFDPNLHEALVVVEGKDNDQIAEVLQKGYVLDDKVLRPARVKVIKSTQEVDSDD